MPRLHGTVARWHAKGGWGFITRDDGLGDVFVHQRSIQKSGYRSLLEGERVEFDVTVREPAAHAASLPHDLCVRPAQRSKEGRLEANKVTGPGGADVLGRHHESQGDDKAEDSASGPMKKSDEPKERPKPYTAFKPRSLAKKPAVVPKKPAAAPAPAPAASEGAAAKAGE